MPRFVTALAAALCALPAASRAHAAEVLTGAQIVEVLSGTTLIYENGAVQTFYASGKTVYRFGEPSWGSWGTRGDQYCSTWPPSGSWECYTLRVHEPIFEFIGEAGDITIGFQQ
ncbi:MAG: hypothetical protein AAGF13_06640 [Pseudomonadota bacterium]